MTSALRMHPVALLAVAGLLVVLEAALVHPVPPPPSPAGVPLAGSVRGRVLDATSGEPLPGAHVYLSHTTLGTATDVDGRFVIEQVPAGAYVLVASMVGFEPAHQEVVVQDGPPVTADLRLREATAAMGEVEVVAEEDRAWRRQLRRFERLFFGPTPRGRQCTLLNPEVLDFTGRGETFTASASAPLVFENRALGYRVTYVLAQFQAEGATVAFGGFPRYEALAPADARERERWAAAREEAYAGSFQHFLRALARGTAAEEGFEGYLLDDLRVPRLRAGGPAFIPRVPFGALVVGGGREDVLAFERVLHVEYRGEAPHREAPTPIGVRGQHSALRLDAPSVRFHALGYLLDPYDATKHGYWAWEGHVGDLLPLDFEPADHL